MLIGEIIMVVFIGAVGLLLLALMIKGFFEALEFFGIRKRKR